MLTEMDGANVDPNKIVMVLGMLCEGKHIFLPVIFNLGNAAFVSWPCLIYHWNSGN